MDLGDPSEFQRAYEQHAPRVRAAALGVLRDPARAEDVTHDVFLRLWRDPTRFDPARGPLGPYLQLMARSRALDIWRSDHATDRAWERARDAIPAIETAAPDRPAELAERRAERAVLVRGIRRLPAPQREAVVLRYFGELTAAEIARRSRIPFGTAKSRLRLGLEKLRQECGGALREPEARASTAR